jgi:hypothetical protein
VTQSSRRAVDFTQQACAWCRCDGCAQHFRGRGAFFATNERFLATPRALVPMER